METVESHNVQSPDDIIELQMHLNRMIGKVCWQATTSYGGEVHADLNDQFLDPFPPGRFPHMERDIVIGTRGSEFRLCEGQDILLSATDYEIDPSAVFRQKWQAVVQLRIQQCSVTYPDMHLSIVFDNNITLDIQNEEYDPDPSRPDADPIAGWDVHFHGEGVLEVWQRRWTFRRWGEPS